MPRNITVTLADGSTHTYANAPDNITPAAVTARAMADFKQSVKSLDGGRAAKPAPAAPAGPPSVKNGFGLGAPPGPKGTPARAAYDAEYNKRFNVAYLAANPAEARRRRIQAGGQQLSSERSSGSGMGDALLAGIRSVPGVNYLTALGRKGAEGIGLADKTNTSVSDIVDLLDARNNADYNKSATGYYTGALASGLGAGKIVARGVQGAARGGVPLVSTVANYIMKLAPTATGGKLALGTRAANTAKLAVAGALGGGAAAADRNQDVATGATVGAIAAPTLGVAGKAVNKLLLQPVATALRLPSAAAILRKYVGTTAEEIQTATAAWKARAGSNAEPTIYEVLDSLKDRESVRAALARMPASARDKAATLVRERAGAIGPEMREKITDVTAPARARIVSGMKNDLALSKVAPGQPVPKLSPEEHALAESAADAPLDLKKLRKTINKNIMAPHDKTVVAATPSDLIPQTLGQPTDPEVSALLGTSLGPRKLGQDITVNDVTRVVSKLKKMLPTAGVQTPIVERTIAHLEDQIPPGAREAYDRMTASNSKYFRTKEGMDEGGMTRTRAAAGDKQAVENAYDTPDGSAGRVLGQTNRLQAGVNVAPDASLRTAGEIADNPQMQEAIGANLGGRGRAGEQIADAAGAQTESARRLTGLGREAEGSGGTDLAGMARSLIGLHPGSMATTKIKALNGLASFFQGIPEGRANQIVDALFSRNPTQIVEALKLFNNAGAAGQDALRKMMTAIGTGIVTGDAANAPEAPQDDDVSVMEPVSLDPAPVDDVPADDANGEPPAPAAPGDDPNVPYGRAVITSLFPEAEITEDVRDPNSDLGRKNPGSEHIKTQNAVDVRPIPGMTFAQFVGKINDSGYQVVEAIDEVNHPSAWATGPHWHVVVA